MGSLIKQERKDYASVKRRLAAYIEETVRSRGECKLSFLHLQAMRQFGLGRRVVDDYIRLLESAGMVSVDWELEEVRSA